MNNVVLVKQLRNKATDAESYLWQYLRKRQMAGCKFRRQCPIGAYIVDFVCFDKMLVIELDGGQHLLDSEKDRQRDAWLNKHGYQVLRFWNDQVFKETEVVLEQIYRALTEA